MASRELKTAAPEKGNVSENEEILSQLFRWAVCLLTRLHASMPVTLCVRRLLDDSGSGGLDMKELKGFTAMLGLSISEEDCIGMLGGTIQVAHTPPSHHPFCYPFSDRHAAAPV